LTQTEIRPLSGLLQKGCIPSLEELGLLKMDFLGLRTLTVINDASKAAGIDIK